MKNLIKKSDKAICYILRKVYRKLSEFKFMGAFKKKKKVHSSSNNKY